MPVKSANVKVRCAKSDESKHNSWCYRERFGCSTEPLDDQYYFRIFNDMEVAKLFIRHFRDSGIEGTY